MKDKVLLDRVQGEMAIFRRRTGIYSVASLLFILIEITTATFSTIASVQGLVSLGFVLSAVAALVLTVEVTVGVRERAIGAHTTFQRLRAIESTMLYGESDPLWDEYNAIHAERKVNFVDGAIMLCS